MGVAPVQANATNTVAIWPGQLTSVFALRGDLRKDLLTVAILCAIAGGVGGAEILLHTPQSMFLHILPWMILAATLLFLFAGRISAWLRRGAKHADTARPVSMLGLTALLLPVCLYVGYFGAGGGLLIMAALGVLGVEHMHELNSMKVLVACIANFSAVVTFVALHAVAWALLHHRHDLRGDGWIRGRALCAAPANGSHAGDCDLRRLRCVRVVFLGGAYAHLTF